MNIFAPRDDLFRSRRELNLGAKHGKRYFLPVTPDIMDAVHQVKVSTCMTTINGHLAGTC